MSSRHALAPIAARALPRSARARAAAIAVRAVPVRLPRTAAVNADVVAIGDTGPGRR